LPAHCTALGKALLAQLPEDLARAALGPEPYEERTPATLTSWAQLRPALEQVRGTGVAESWEEYEIGLVSIAVPVAWLDGPGTAAVNVSLPITRATDAFRAGVGERLRRIARRLESGRAAASALSQAVS
jgi:IclR family acetate operon transcriptional repressor